MPTKKRRRVTFDTGREGGADQSHRDSTDINSILANFMQTGQMHSVNRSKPLYGDFSNSRDLHQALNIVRDAEASFAMLPASVRQAALNDPTVFLDMVEDDTQLQHLIDAGLVLSEDQAGPPHPKPPAAAPQQPPEDAQDAVSSISPPDQAPS